MRKNNPSYLDIIKAGKTTKKKQRVAVHNPALDGLVAVVEEMDPSGGSAKPLSEIEDNLKNLKKARRTKLNMNKNSFSGDIDIKKVAFKNYLNLMVPLANMVKQSVEKLGWSLGMVKNKFVARKGDHYISNLLTLRKMISKLNPDYYLSGWEILNGWNKWMGGFNSSRFKKSALNPKKKRITFVAAM